MLDVLLGEWSMEAVFPGTRRSDARGRVSFEWRTGARFLIQRWEIARDGTTGEHDVELISRRR